MLNGPDPQKKKQTVSKDALLHLVPLRRFAARLAETPDHADELVQETYLRALRFFHRFEPGTNGKAWLFTILRNVARNRHRAWSREFRHRATGDFDTLQSMIPATGDFGRDPERLLLARNCNDDVLRAIRTLPETFRVPVVLVDLEDRSYTEVARILECPVGTVRSRLSRGRRILRRYLTESTEEDPLLYFESVR